ncbi:hypothetical protein TRSC58_03255 [Trypanosoma rangeli SC58]|uniref:Uncharacterized protein n=1 Tax=Trypanosoma rangeli SC58 TaxID=429131 RepID=A0A061J6V3_TRYRA|nr:hypothetical protein TRSC58_03255 [Trypanosoma rangeli SC58]
MTAAGQKGGTASCVHLCVVVLRCTTCEGLNFLCSATVVFLSPVVCFTALCQRKEGRKEGRNEAVTHTGPQPKLGKWERGGRERGREAWNQTRMEKRTAPRPTRASVYFFEQLLPPTVTSCSPEAHASSSDHADMGETVSEAVAAILKESFSPSETAALLQRCTDVEQVSSEALEGLLEAAWTRVEDIMARNKQRRRAIEEELPQSLAEFDAYKFWTPEVAAAHFNFPTPEEFGLCSSEAVEDKGEAGTSRLLADTVEPADHNVGFSNEPPQDSADAASSVAAAAAAAAAAGAPATAVAPGQRRAKVWTKTEKDLLDPSKSPHCLRRLFAPILQRRQELPKTLTLLLNAIQRVQSKGFPEIEALIEKGYFHMPLHRSFLHISSFIMRYLSEGSRGEDRELAFADVYKPASVKFKEAWETLREMGGKGGAASSTHDTAAEMVYSTLLNELWERKVLHTDCDNALQSITEDTTQQLDRMDKGLQECDGESLRVLASLEQNARAYMDKLREAIERTKATRAEIHAEYQRDHDRLQSSLQAKLYQAKKSEDAQEKLARRIRETTKEWYTEQLKYERLMQEVIAETLALRQLDHSHDQLEAFLDERWLTSESEQKLRWVTDSLRQSQELRSELIAQCRQHIDRLKTDEHYRRCRMVGYATENALQWSRCLHDLSHLYEGHYDTIATKCEASMQLRYLLAYEKNLVVKDMHQLQREFSLLENNWAKLTSLQEELELPVPPLAQCEKDLPCKEFRRIISELVSGRLICGDFARLLPIRTRGRSPPGTGRSEVTATDVGG